MKRAVQAPLFDASPRKLVTPHARATSTFGKSKRPAPAPKPWECTILSVDTAQLSGWSTYECGAFLDSGEIDTTDECEVEFIVLQALQLCTPPPVLVLEAPYGGWKSPGQVKTLVALGAARERWERAWKAAGEAKGRIVRVQPSTWRAATLGNIRGLDRNEIRKREQQAAGVIAGRPTSPDESAAILIGRWAAYASKVGEVIGARAVQASMKAWQQ